MGDRLVRWEDTIGAVEELIVLHDEALFKWLELDGHCKSHEGLVQITIPNAFTRRRARDEGRRVLPRVSVYAYVLGPSRMHDFSTPGKALAEVRRWTDDTDGHIERARLEMREGLW